jgi:hypothetical protein
MRAFLSALAALAVIALGFWAYRENYATHAALDQVARLERDIARAREEVSVLRAEWAYLNRPDRLRDLAELNFDRLGLLPLLPEQFGSVEQVSYPQGATFSRVGRPIDVIQSEERTE